MGKLIIYSLDHLERDAVAMEKEWREFNDREVSINVLYQSLLSIDCNDSSINQLLSKLAFDLLSYMASLKEKTSERDKEKGLKLPNLQESI